MKIRKPGKAPYQMTVTFHLLGCAKERMAQYMFIKMHERVGTLASQMQAFYQCALSSQSPEDWAIWSEGLVLADDIREERAVITRNWKLTYAKHFGCKQRHIKYWYQSSDEQQETAILRWGVASHRYVYRVTVAGLIVDRRLVARDDSNEQA